MECGLIRVLTRGWLEGKMCRRMKGGVLFKLLMEGGGSGGLELYDFEMLHVGGGKIDRHMMLLRRC